MRKPSSYKIKVSQLLGRSISIRRSVTQLMEGLPEQENVLLDFEHVNFLSRTAAQELVKYINLYKKQGHSVRVVNTNDTVADTLKAATKKSKVLNWLFVDGVLVASGLLIHHTTKPKQVKRSLEKF